VNTAHDSSFTPESLPSPPRARVTEADRREAHALPLATRFALGPEITGVQQAFLDEHGFLVFAKVLTDGEIARILSAIDAIQTQWIAEGRKEIHGIPLFVGRDPDGKPYVQRFAFTSLFSTELYELVRDSRFAPIRSLVGTDVRVGDREKDGLVFNRNLNVPGSAYPRLGWHTDGLRDLFLNREIPGPMLNVGLHFDRVKRADGGLRILPGSHTQGFWDMLTRKAYFLDHRPDPDEVAVETEPGDLTVHDGRTWHRVERSPHVGWRSLRRTMYVPYVTDTYAPKHEGSKMPFYHRLGRVARELRVALRR
jgi:phytanoyl-CoA hydroxylase